MNVDPGPRDDRNNGAPAIWVSGVCFAVLAQFDDVARLETFDRAHRLARIALDQRQARSPKRRPPRPSRSGCRSVGNSGRFKTRGHRIVIRCDRQKTDPSSFASYFVGELSTLARTHPEQCRIQRYDTHRGPPISPAVKAINVSAACLRKANRVSGMFPSDRNMKHWQAACRRLGRTSTSSSTVH